MNVTKDYGKGYAQNKVLEDIVNERNRQEQLMREGAFPATCASYDLDDYEKLAILGEEFGEVATACMQTTGINSTHDTNRDLYKELIQVAAVATAWAESFFKAR